MQPNIFNIAPFDEIALLLGITAIAGAIAVRLRQPVLIAYIIIGIMVGPTGFELVQAHDQVDLLAQIGVAMLLFLVGLKLDLNHVRHIGPVALATGLGQLGFTILFGFILVMALGKDIMEALYVAVALTFSSTIIIIKLLSDKRELDSLHGRIAVGFLIVQDIAVVLAMMTMSTMRVAGDDSLVTVLASLGMRVSAAALVMFVLMRFILPKIVSAMARSQELLLIFAIAWGTGLAALGEWAGFSKEAGAFLAGFSLASTAYREAIGARLSGIRDFLLLFFFIDLGSKLDFSTLGDELFTAAILSAFVLVGNPFIVMAIMGYMGYRKRTGFLAGLTVAQISEFSIVFIAMGISLGHIGVEALGLTTLVGIITITLSTYMILFSQPLYERLSPWLGIFERKTPYRELAVEQPTNQQHTTPDIAIFGLGRFGSSLAHRLQDSGLNVMGVEFDPEVVHHLCRQGLNVRFGDAQDPDFLDSLPLEHTAYAVSTLPDLDSNRALLHALQQSGFRGQLMVMARDEWQYQALARAGVTNLISPFRDAMDVTVEKLIQIIQTEKKTS